MKGVEEENTIRKFAVLVLSHATCPKLAKQGLGIWTHHHGDILGGDELCIFFFLTLLTVSAISRQSGTLDKAYKTTSIFF